MDCGGFVDRDRPPLDFLGISVFGGRRTGVGGTVDGGFKPRLTTSLRGRAGVPFQCSLPLVIVDLLSELDVVRARCCCCCCVTKKSTSRPRL